MSSSDPILSADGVTWAAFADCERMFPPPVTLAADSRNIAVRDHLDGDQAKALSVRVGAAAIQAKIGKDRSVFAEAERLLAEQFDRAVEKLLGQAESDDIKAGDRVELCSPDDPHNGVRGVVEDVDGGEVYVVVVKGEDRVLCCSDLLNVRRVSDAQGASEERAA